MRHKLNNSDRDSVNNEKISALFHNLLVLSFRYEFLLNNGNYNDESAIFLQKVKLMVHPFIYKLIDKAVLGEYFPHELDVFSPRMVRALRDSNSEPSATLDLLLDVVKAETEAISKKLNKQ